MTGQEERERASVGRRELGRASADDVPQHGHRESRDGAAVHHATRRSGGGAIGVRLLVVRGFDAEEQEIRSLGRRRHTDDVRAGQDDAPRRRQEDVEAPELRVAPLAAACLGRQGRFGEQVLLGGTFVARQHDLPSSAQAAGAVVADVGGECRRDRIRLDEEHRGAHVERELDVRERERDARASAGEPAGHGDILVRATARAHEPAHVEEARGVPALRILIGSTRHRRRDRHDVGERAAAGESRALVSDRHPPEDRRGIASITAGWRRRHERAAPEGLDGHLIAQPAVGEEGSRRALGVHVHPGRVHAHLRGGGGGESRGEQRRDEEMA